MPSLDKVVARSEGQRLKDISILLIAAITLSEVLALPMIERTVGNRVRPANEYSAPAPLPGSQQPV